MLPNTAFVKPLSVALRPNTRSVAGDTLAGSTAPLKVISTIWLAGTSDARATLMLWTVSGPRPSGAVLADAPEDAARAATPAAAHPTTSFIVRVAIGVLLAHEGTVIPT